MFLNIYGPVVAWPFAYPDRYGPFFTALEDIQHVQLLHIKQLLLIVIHTVRLYTLVPHVYGRVVAGITQVRGHFPLLILDKKW